MAGAPPQGILKNDPLGPQPAHVHLVSTSVIWSTNTCNDDSCAGETWTGSDPCSTYQCVRNEIHTVTQDCPEIKSCALVRNLCSRIKRFYYQICYSSQLSVLTTDFLMAVSKTLTLFKLKCTFPTQLKQVC